MSLENSYRDMAWSDSDVLAEVVSGKVMLVQTEIDVGLVAIGAVIVSASPPWPASPERLFDLLAYMYATLHLLLSHYSTQRSGPSSRCLAALLATFEDAYRDPSAAG